MQKIDKVVLKETKYIALWVLIFSAILQAVFLIIGKWDYTVLLGNLWGAAAIIANFFAIGITVQRALNKDEKDAKQALKASGIMRTFFLFLVALAGVLLPIFSIWAVLPPLIFPRIAIAIRPFLDKKNAKGKENGNEG